MAKKQANVAERISSPLPTPHSPLLAPLPTPHSPLLETLESLYPDAECALVHSSPLQLLIATILSAQCTDKRVNLVTPALFARFPDAAAFAKAKLPQIEKLIRTTGFFRNKAKNIQQCCKILTEQHGGEVPGTLEELVKLPGVGRKTANVILGNAFSTPGITVDTHVGRLSRRLGLTAHKDPAKVKRDLMRNHPQGGVDKLQPPAHLPWPASLPCPQTELRRLRDAGILPKVGVGDQMVQSEGCRVEG